MKLLASLIGIFELRTLTDKNWNLGLSQVNGQSACPPPLHSRVAHSFVLPQQVSEDGVVLDEEKCVYAFRDRNYPLG